jgi:hypothetical protein
MVAACGRPLCPCPQRESRVWDSLSGTKQILCGTRDSLSLTCGSESSSLYSTAEETHPSQHDMSLYT